MKVYEMTIADIASEIFDKGEDFAEKIFNDIDELEKNKLLEINKLKQQLAEKDARITELEDKDWYEACIKQLEEQNNRLIDTLKEKDKEIAHLKDFIGCKGCLDVIKKSNDNQTQLAIQELAEVERLLYESHYKEIGNRYYAEYEDIKNLIDSRIKALEELKGENK